MPARPLTIAEVEELRRIILRAIAFDSADADLFVLPSEDLPRSDDSK